MEVPSLKKNVALNVTKTLFSLIFPLITFPYASRILLPDGIGKVNFARAIIEYFVLVATLGISVYGIREAAKVRDDKVQLSKITKELFIINIVSTVFAYIILAVAMLCIPKLSSYRALLCVISATILFTALGLDWLYTAVEDFEYITKRYIFFNALSLVLLFVFVKEQKDYLWYASISVFANVGSNILNFVHSRIYLDFSIVHKLEFKKHLKPICILFAMAIAIKVYTVLDTTMLGFICNDWQVGIYTAAIKIDKIILSLVVAACAVLLPRLSYYSENDVEKFNKLAYKGLDVLLLVSIPCCIGLFLLSYHVIILLSGEHYIESVPVMRIMNPIILIIGMSNFIGMQLFMPLRKERYTLYSVVCGAVFNFILNLILIPRFQALGAAISTLCAESVVTVVQLFLARNIINLKKISSIFVIYALNAVVMGLLVFVIIRNIDSVLFSFIVCTISGSLVYFILLVFEKNEIIFSTIKAFQGRIKC